MTQVESNANYLIVPLKTIRVKADRARKEFKDIMKLAESIKANGLINPIYVANDPEKPDCYVLVAGERRYRASIMAGLTKVPVSFKDQLSELKQKIIELEENLCRENLEWQEEAELHNQIDELKRQENPGWTQKETAELVQLSPSQVSRQITLANALKADPEFKAKVAKLDMNSALKVLDQKEKVARVTRLQEQGKLEITSNLKLGNCVDLIKELPAQSVDLLIMDPPYAIESLEDMREGTSYGPGFATMSEHHNSDLDTVLKLLAKLAPEFHRVLKPGAHMYVFSAYQHAGDFIRALAPAEFQPPMLHWDRGRNMGPGLGYNYLNRTECLIYMHNPPRGKRLAKSMYNVLEFPTVAKNERVYATEKPVALLKALINQSSIVGDTVLDCFAGSGSTLAAAKSLGRKSIGFEINPDSWKIAQLRLANEKELQK